MTLVTPENSKPTARVEELQEIRGGMNRMLKRLWPSVEAGEFGVIIGDDTSGRIPALIARKVINRWNAEHGLPKIPIVFISGTGDENDRRAQEQAFKEREHLLRTVDPSKRALVVTEGITTGHSIASIGRLLTEAGFAWDVAALDGDGFNPRTPAQDAERVAAAEAEWDQRKTGLEDDKADSEKRLAKGTKELQQRRAYLDIQLASRLKEVAAEKKQLETKLKAETDAPERFLKGRKQRQRIEEIQQVIEAYDSDKDVATLNSALAACDDTARDLADLEQRIARLDAAIKAAEGSDFSQVLAGDERGIWADDTRLFRGKHNAHSVRDRPDMTGLSQAKFSDDPVVRDADTRRTVEVVRRGIDQSIAGYLNRVSFQTDTVLKIFPAARWLIDQLRIPIVNDRYGVVVGDDTSGRVPALLIAKTINIYAKRHGRPRVPTLFIEGIRDANDEDQIKAFRKLKRAIRGVDRSKRALVVTDNFSANDSYSRTSGMSAGSVAWRLHQAGFKVDIATISPIRVSTADRIRWGYWPPDSRGFAGDGDPDIIINNTAASGLSQRRPKFSPNLVEDGRGVRLSVAEHRRDISKVAAFRLADRLDAPLWVEEIHAITPGIREVVRGLKDAVHSDEISAIVGEDSGGRVPALLVGKAINTWRVANGMKRLPVVFLSGGASDASLEALDNRYGALVDSIGGGRALYFSGNIHSGKTSGPVTWWLHRHGLAVDVIPPREPDYSCENYINSEVLPPGARILTESGLTFYDRTSDAVNLHAHPEVTGIQLLDDGGKETVSGGLQPQVELARNSIKQMVPSLVQEL